ncbi:MAG TPA: glycosyltransferase family 4 protein [Bacillales bacterium]|nr:glycosyltransferase family 4 protein [Bacillales bacterium]
MPRKVLFCATVDYHFKAFHLPYLKWFKDQGWEVHIAASGGMDLPYVDEKFDLPIQRSPFNRENLRAYKELQAIIHRHQYRIIHCHTPMGGVLGRLAARQARKKGTKIIYTAHGFHFCKGAPLLNWIVYYPIEKGLARFTDCLITINEEDYSLAVQRKFSAKRIEHIHGVGIDLTLFKLISLEDKKERRKSYGYNPDDFLLFYAAEFNKNKNQQMLIEMIALIKSEVPNVQLLLAGEGVLFDECRSLAKKIGVEKNVHFLGFRKDIQPLLSITDVAVASSLREGLPVNIMEAMATGIPIVASDNRGHRELVLNNENGWVIDRDDKDGFARKVILLAHNKDLRIKLGANGRKMMERKYGTNQILLEKSRIYTTYMKEQEEMKWALH